MTPPDWLAIAGKELLEILRDRRSLFFAFFLPLFLYPGLFFATTKMEAARQGVEAGKPARVGLAGESAPLFERLAGDPDLDPVPAPADLSLVEGGEVDALVVLAPGSPPLAHVYYASGRPESRQAWRRLQAALDSWRDDLLAARFGARGSPVDPREVVSVADMDLSDPSDRAGAALGRLLPFILVTLLIAGGAFAAVDLLAGEKERGTLETLFVQPVRTGSVVAGKFVAVLATSLASVVLNLAGMALALAIGLGPQGGPAGLAALPAPGAVAVVLLLLVPLAVLSSAVLLAVSAFARSYRQAQIFLFPLVLVGMVPALIAAAPDIRLSAAVAVIPVANVALAVRDALTGDVRPLHVAVTLASTAAYAALALRWTAGLLEREDLRLGIELDPALAASGAARARRGIAFGFVMVLAVGVSGGLLQRPDGPLGIWGGLAVTLWGVVLVPALGYVAVRRLPVRETLALRVPRIRDVAAAAALIPPAAVLVTAYLAFQDSVLPFPDGLRREFERLFAGGDLDPVLGVLLIVVSPAICEELLWRGAVQGDIEAAGRPVATVLWIGFLFGLFHLSPFRLIPTGLLGGVLAWLRLRTGSIVPGMVFHGLYNATMLAAARWQGSALDRVMGEGPAALAVVGAAAAFAAVVRWGFAARRPVAAAAGPS